MRRRRIALLAVAALGLAPGTFVRETPPAPDYRSPVRIAPLSVAPLKSGPLTLAGAWVLTSENDHFGGYSALIDRGDGTFLAASDAGRLMILPRPDRPGPRPFPRLGQFVDFSRVDKVHVDIESLARNPASGEIWAGLEWANAIIRFGPALQRRREVRPAAMEEWESNGGPESLVRLADGRFLVIEESRAETGGHEALVFTGDPTRGGKPRRVMLQGLPGHHPADATLLPDGRILIVMRQLHWELPLRFSATLVIADPARIGADATLPITPLAPVGRPLPSDNYEGAAVTLERDGNWAIWLISDDNFVSFQRTLLVKLIWPQSTPAP